MTMCEVDQNVLIDVVCDDIEYQLMEWKNNDRLKKVNLSTSFFNVHHENSYFTTLSQNISNMTETSGVFRNINTYELFKNDETKSVMNRYCEVFGIKTAKF